MIGWGGFLLLASALLGGDGRGVPPSAILPAALPPSEFLTRTADSWVVFHRHDEWQMAFSTRAGESLETMSLSHSEGLFPGLRRDRLFLYGPYYRQDSGRIRPLRDMSVDVAEHLFKALLMAHLQKELEHQSTFRSQVVLRYTKLFAAVPTQYRQAAYLEAVSDFGAYILSLANEMERLMTRAEDRGRNPCDLLASHLPMVRLWESSMGSAGFFPGGYWQPSTATEPGVWRVTQKSLEAEDKSLVLEQVLEVPWTGRARQDLASLCKPSEESAS